MTPEDIEILKQLKKLKDDGVITEAEFETQKQLVLREESASQDPELLTSQKDSTEVEDVNIVENSEGKTDEEFGNIALSSLEKSEWTSRDSRKVAVGLVVVGVVIAAAIFGFSRDKDEDVVLRQKYPLITTTTAATVNTEGPNLDSSIDYGQVWNWYYLQLNCASEVVAEVEGIKANMTNREKFVSEVLPLYSSWAGVDKKVAEQIRSSLSKWPKDVRKEALAMANFLFERSFLFSTATRTSPEDFNNILKNIADLEIGTRFATLDSAIVAKIGVDFLVDAGSGITPSCDMLRYYEDNPPDFSIVPLPNVGTDIFYDFQLRNICGMVRDLQAPRGNNPKANIDTIAELSNDLFERFLVDERNGQPESKFYSLGVTLAAMMENYLNPVAMYLPLSHQQVVDHCASFGW